MATLTVFLAPDEGAGEILDVLHDLSGAGLLEPFLWLPAAGAACHEFAAIGVAGGRRYPTSVQDVVVDARHDRVRLCVLVPLTTCPEPISGLLEQEVAALLAANAGGAPVTRIRYLLTRGGSCSPQDDDVAHEGWHNVFVAPERSAQPGAGRWVLPATISPADAAREFAPALAGIGGLWTGAPECVLDTLPVPAGCSVRAARAFYRRVEADDVEAELRARVLATRPELPLPRERHGAYTGYLRDVGVACAMMAGHLWAQHGGLLPGRRAGAEVQRVSRVGVRAAASWLPSYLLAALRDDPRRWYAGVVARLREAVPHRDQAATFAALPGSYSWIVQDARPDGRPVGWDEVGEIADEIDAAAPPLSTGAAPPDRPADLSALWRDFAAGALTLADAGDRGGQAMPPAPAGSGRGVLRVTADCVPGPEQDFVIADGGVAARVGVPVLAAGDVLGTDLLRRRLMWMAQYGTLTKAAKDTYRALDEWEKRHKATYVWCVGSPLAARLQEVAGELRGHLGAVARAAADPDELFRTQQRWQLVLSRVVLAIAGVALAAVLVTLLTIAFVVGPAAGVLLTLAGAVLVGVVGTPVVYGIGQRRLFRELEHRQALIERVEAEQPNLRRALRDYRQLRDAYADFLQWSRAVATVLGEPFGRSTGGSDARLPTLRELPPSVRIGRATVDPPALPGAVAILRGDLFVTGWLSGPWRSNLDVAVRRFAAGVHGPAGAASRLESVLGTRSSASANPPLRAWSRQIEADGPTAEIGHRAWSSVMASLSAHRAEVGESLLSSIRPADGRDGTSALAEFLAGVDRPAGSADQWFDAAHFTASAQVEERARVAGGAPSGSRTGLSRTDVLVQFGDAFPAWDLELVPEHPEADGPPAADDGPRF